MSHIKNPKVSIHHSGELVFLTFVLNGTRKSRRGREGVEMGQEK